MPIAFIRINSLASFGTNPFPSALTASVDELVASADGLVILSTNNQWAERPISGLQLGFESLPGSADSINSVILRVRAGVGGNASPDDSSTYRFQMEGGTGFGSESVTWTDADSVAATDGNLVNREVTITGSPSVAQINAAECFVEQTAWGQVMGPDGMHLAIDCAELEVDYDIAGGATLTADPGALILTGASAALARGLASDPGALQFTGGEATLSVTRLLPADPGALQLTGASAALAAALTAAPGALLLTGGEATLSVSRLLQADPGVLQLTGADAALAIGLASSPGLLLFTGAEADLKESGDETLTADPGALQFTGAEADLTEAAAPLLIVRRGGVRWLREPDPEIREEKTKELTALIKPRLAPKPTSREPQEPQETLLSMVSAATARMTAGQQKRIDRLLQETGISLRELLILLE